MPDTIRDVHRGVPSDTLSARALLSKAIMEGVFTTDYFTEKLTKRKRHGRKKPYSETGIKRLPCFRCGKRASCQWQVCADDNLYRPLCLDCDLKLNREVLHWMRFPDADAKFSQYQKAKGIDSDPR